MNQGKTKMEAPQVVFDISCPECKCDVIIPLIKLRAIRSFSGNKIQVEWPSRDEQDEFARVACPQCGLVMVVKADGAISKSPNRLFGANGKKKGK